MAVTAHDKAKVIAENQRGKGDTGSPEVQIALLTARINGLTDHFKTQRQGSPFAPRPAAHGVAPPQAARLPEARNADSYRALIDNSACASKPAADVRSPCAAPPIRRAGRALPMPRWPRSFASAAIVVYGTQPMFKHVKKIDPVRRHTLTLETGEIARQAGGAVLVSLDDTVVLVTVRRPPRPRKPGQDFFPLTVDYQEKTYAAGKIPGGFFKREGRPSEKEILTCA